MAKKIIFYSISVLIIVICIITIFITMTLKSPYDLMLESENLERQVINNSYNLVISSGQLTHTANLNGEIKGDNCIKDLVLQYDSDYTLYKNIGDILDEGDIIAQSEYGNCISTFKATIINILFQTEQLIIKLLDYSELYIEFYFEENLISKISFETEININFNKNFLKGEITYIDYKSENGMFLATAKFIQFDPFVRPGMNIYVEAVLETKDNVLIISRDYVYKDIQNKYYLIIKQGNSYVNKIITVGMITERYVEITSGVKENEIACLSSINHKDVFS